MNKNVKGSLIHYEILGKGIPIVMIHGIYVDLQLMKGCMEPIFKENQCYERIYIDMPGMGKSKVSDSIRSDADMVDILSTVIKDIVGEREFLIVGQSFGAHITRGILNRLWEQVKGVCFICPCIVPSYQSNPERKIIYKDEAFISKLSKEEYEKFNLMSVIQNEYTYERYMNDTLPGLNSADYKFLDRLETTASFIWEATWKTFYKPTLIITGRQDDVAGYKAAYDILDGFPRATFTILDGAGHNLQFERVNIFNTLVIDWLKRTEDNFDVTYKEYIGS